MTDKEQIIINGVDVSECEYLTYQLEEDGEYYWFCDIAPAGGPDECEYKPECFYKRALKQLARKTQECEQIKEKYEALKLENEEGYEIVAELKQECEKLEDFRTLAREVFTFGDSDVDDENFIKYLQEYSRSYEEAIDGYYRLTDITGIDYTVHGGADIEEIIKQVTELKQEREELKEKLKREIKNTVDMERLAKSYGQDMLTYRQEKQIEIEEFQTNIDRYRKALEEIEEVIKSPCAEDCVYYEPSRCYDCIKTSILDIISKAKGEENAE